MKIYTFIIENDIVSELSECESPIIEEDGSHKLYENVTYADGRQRDLWLSSFPSNNYYAFTSSMRSMSPNRYQNKYINDKIYVAGLSRNRMDQERYAYQEVIAS